MRLRVLVAHADANPPGGGNAIFAWTLQALQDNCDVTVLSWYPVDLAAINRFYGTSVHPEAIAVRCCGPALLHRFVPRVSILLIKHCSMTPRCRAMGSEFDVMLCTSEEMDFGRPGVHYIHFPRYHDWRFNPRIPRPADLSGKKWYHRRHQAVRLYVRLCERWFGVSAERMRENLTLVNSDWTGLRIGESLGVSSTTVYPPVPQDFPDVPWEHREDGFVCIGRLAPEKRIETMVEIIAGLRARGWPVHLHVVGSGGPPDHQRRIEALCASHADWIFLETDLSREALAKCVTSHRYGIHGMQEEHFGIAVAELAQGGTVVFVPNNGGQVEIVGRRAELIYSDCAEAISRIEAVLADQRLRDSLRAHLKVQAAKFTATVFMERMRTIVAEAARRELRNSDCGMRSNRSAHSTLAAGGDGIRLTSDLIFSFLALKPEGLVSGAEIRVPHFWERTVGFDMPVISDSMTAWQR